MEKWYMATSSKVTEVNVVNETTNFVVVKGMWGERRESKDSKYSSYFKTYAEAYKNAIDRNKLMIEKAIRTKNYYENKIAEFKAEHKAPGVE